MSIKVTVATVACLRHDSDDPQKGQIVSVFVVINVDRAFSGSWQLHARVQADVALTVSSTTYPQ